MHTCKCIYISVYICVCVCFTGESSCFKIVKMIMERNFAPVIVFSFSKKDCEAYAMQMSKLDFNTGPSQQTWPQLGQHYHALHFCGALQMPIFMICIFVTDCTLLRLARCDVHKDLLTCVMMSLLYLESLPCYITMKMYTKSTNHDDIPDP